MKIRYISLRLSLALFSILITASISFAQSWLWAIQNNSGGFPSNPKTIQAEDGNMYVLSYFHNTVIFGQDTFPGSGNIMLIQFNSAGNISDLKKIGTGLNINKVVPTKDGSNHFYLVGLLNSNIMTLDTLSIPQSFNGLIGFIARMDTQGKLKWFKTLDCTEDTPVNGLTTDTEGNIYFSGGLFGQMYYAGDTLTSSGSSPNIYLAKMDKNGQEIWVRQVQGQSFLSIVDVNHSGLLYLGGRASGTVYFDSLSIQQASLSDGSYFVAAYDTNGQIQWVNPLKVNSYTTRLHLRVNQHTGAALFSGTFAGDPLIVDSTTLTPNPGGTDIFITEYQPDGSLSWLEHISGQLDEHPDDLAIGPDGGIFLAGEYNTNVSLGNLQASTTSPFDKMFVLKWTADKSALWLGSGEGSASQSISTILVDSLGEIFMSGYVNGGSAILGPATLTPPMSFFIARMDDSTYTPPGPERLVHGRIWGESDLNCVRDSGEWDLAQWVVIAEPGPHYAATRPDGTYTLRLDTGTYTIRQLMPSNVPYILNAVCPTPGSAYTVQIDSSVTDTAGFDFIYEYDENYFCPNLSVEITNSRRRICTINSTHISFCNSGNAEVNNIQIHVRYPPEVRLSQASVPYTEIDSSYYILNAGLLLPNECGSIVLNELVDCDVLSRIGESSCMEVWITPINTCAPPDSNWSGASLVVDGSCVAADSVSFIINNDGQGDMVDSSGYELFLNDTPGWYW